ncbi:hypothetical protein [Vibrio sp. S9_S30]|uniref:hypothetical protein n=1 Tax=Vibrio sp. S9_S30 TaxID=2720226 RepID=UPI001EEF7873|nr:hypothetical protein [Vibrio sp. S9_S30]
MPRVGGRFEALVRAIQTENSLGNEALSMHSMNDILANKTYCNQTTKPKTPTLSRIQENEPRAKLQHSANRIDFESLQQLG